MYVNTREYIEMSRSFNLKFYYQASNMVLKTDHVRFFIFSLSQIWGNEEFSYSVFKNNNQLVGLFQIPIQVSCQAVIITWTTGKETASISQSSFEL